MYCRNRTRLLAAGFFGLSVLATGCSGGGNAPPPPLLAAGGSAATFYIVGNTTSPQFPVTNGSTYETGGDGQNGAFSVLTRNGTSSTSLAFSTFLGSGAGTASGGTQIRDLWIDPSGDIYMGGTTSDPSFPTTPGTFQPAYGGGPDDAFICRFSPVGTKKWCSYLGTNSTQQAEEKLYSIAGYDPNGNLTICGRMNGQSGTYTIGGITGTVIGPAGANQVHSFVAKVRPDGSALVWFTLVGGSAGGGIRGRCVLEAGGNVIAGGEDSSLDFPATPGSFQPTNRSKQSPPDQGIVLKMAADGSHLIWASYLGGSSSSQVFEGADGGIALDTSGNVYVSGFTDSTDLFGSGATGYQKTLHATTSGYIAKIKSDGSAILNSTYLGGSTAPSGVTTFAECAGTTLDGSGNVIVLGDTPYTDYPVTAGAFQAANKGGVDGVLSKLSPDLSTLLASTYLGGSGNDISDHSAKIGFDANGNIFSMLGTNSPDFPRTADAYQKTYVGNAYDMVIFGLTPDFKTLVYGTYLAGPVPTPGSTLDFGKGSFPWSMLVTTTGSAPTPSP